MAKKLCIIGRFRVKMLVRSLTRFILLMWCLLLASSQITDQNYVSCPGGGICIPSYLCENGTINTNGDGLIDLRFGGEDQCPLDLVCCRDTNAEEGTGECNATCVEFYQCFDDVHDSLMEKENLYCPNDKVCCRNVRQITPIPKCMGQCVPSSQCYNWNDKDRIDLRFVDGDCNDENLVCCMEPEITIPQLGSAELCNGRCVPPQQCSNVTMDATNSDMIDLRQIGRACPEDLICCSDEVKPKPTCQGMCTPASECLIVSSTPFGKDAIDLRDTSNGCDRAGLVCCKELINPTPSSQSVCDGSCVPVSQCGITNAGGNEDIDLRISDSACPYESICCKTEPKLIQASCTCVPFHQCLDDMTNSTHVDLRLNTEQCSSQQICCQKIKPILQELSIPQPAECRGACVPFHQCQNETFNTDGSGIIIPRSYNGCTDDLVCCDDLSKTSEIVDQQICEGRCVPSDECPGGTNNIFGLGLINLRRRSHNICQGNLVCCVESLPTTENNVQTINNCKGKCVPSADCNTFIKDSIDVRIYGDCPRDLVCCAATDPSPESALVTTIKPDRIKCNGFCVSLEQCGDPAFEMMNHIIDLRFGSGENDCTIGTVCCTNPIRKSPEEEQWLHWIQDMNNMVDHQDTKTIDKCYLDIDLRTNRIRHDEVPWLTTIWRRKEYLQNWETEYICAGALIRSDVVLLPADCIHGDTSDRLLVRIGNYDLTSTNGYQEHHVAKKVIHPDFNKAFNTDNIALLFLRERSGTNHPMACIFDPNEAFNDRDCLAVGWNYLHFLGTGTSSIEPNKQHISILRSPNCPLRTLCTAGRDPSNQSCNRMHGATVICPDRMGQQNWKIVGMVPKNNERCDVNGIPETLVSLPQVAPWIREQLSPSFVQKPVDLGPSRKYLPAL
nr:uncharacterized protein LOC115257757 [Aedes albopictus]